MFERSAPLQPEPDFIPDTLQSDEAIRLKHQRPHEGADWDETPPELWNNHQKIAHATGGWATVANGITALGAAGLVWGGYEYAQGNRARGVAIAAAARGCDLLDGTAAAHFGTRSAPGALLDASVDKAAIIAAVAFGIKEGLIAKPYALATCIQQVRIVRQNVMIQKMGGSPNPNEPGKRAMFFASGAFLLRGAEQALQSSRPQFSRWMGYAALSAEAAAIWKSEKAIEGYRSQRLQSKAKKPSVHTIPMRSLYV